MFGLGATELIVIGVVFVLLFGASKIPKVAAALGRAKGEFAKARQESEAGVVTEVKP